MRSCLVVMSLALVVGIAEADKPKLSSPQREYADLSRLIHKMVVKEIPREFEDRSGWGQIVPLTEKLRFPNLQRTRVRLGDKEGYPHGLWKKFKVRFDDPDKDVKIDVREFSKIDPKTFHLVVDAEAAFTG